MYPSSSSRSRDTVSIARFEIFLKSQGFEIQRLYVQQQFLLYLEVLLLATGDLILVSIPSSYTFDDLFSEQYRSKLVLLREVEVKLENSLTDYLSFSESGVRSMYEEAAERLAPELPLTTGTLDRYLDESYKKFLLVDDIAENLQLQARSAFRQINRLKFCMQGLSHVIGIRYSIKRDGYTYPYLLGVLNSNRRNIHIFVSMQSENLQIPSNPITRLMLSINMQYFYDRHELIQLEIERLYSGLFSVLDTNRQTHLENTRALLGRYQTLLDKVEAGDTSERDKLDGLLRQYGNLLTEARGYEQEKEKEYMEMCTTLNDSSTTSHGHLKRAHLRKKSGEDLEKIRKTEGQLLKNLTSLQDKKSTKTLTLDAVLFENTVLLDRLEKNLAKLGKMY